MDMLSSVLSAVLVVVGVGIVGAVILVIASKFFAVEEDPRIGQVQECLPGANCGACGYAGCDAMAAAIAKGEAPVNGCPVGGSSVADKIGGIMGVAAEEGVKKAAFVRCKGTCEVNKNQGNYIGVQDCRSAALSGLCLTDCSYCCLGLGSCVNVCPADAIHVVNGVAVVNTSRCVSCGLCVKACPKGLIEIKPVNSRVAVQCSNKDRGPAVKAVCSAGCIGCTLCEKQCESDAIHVVSNLAQVNYENCTQCGKCAAKCPTKVITPPAAM